MEQRIELGPCRARHREIHVLELPGADHALEVPGDPVKSLAGLSQMTDAIMRFVDRI
jgi:hypothetical protein